MSTHRLGLVSYLNTAPYRFGLRQLGETNWVEDVPAKLLPLLESGEVEAAVLPTFDVLTSAWLRPLPSGCISSFGEAVSVKLFSRVPLRQVTSVGLDTSSHTSAALVRVLFAELGAHPAFLDMSPDLSRMLASADAALLIGDPCMKADPVDVLVYDLGAEWLELTGGPVVFALWAARPGADVAALDRLIGEARDVGLASLDRIAEEESRRLALDPEQVLVYLRDHMRYHLDGPARVGVEKLRKLLVKHRLIPDHGVVRFELEA